MKHLNVLLTLSAVLFITTTGIAAQNPSASTAKEQFKSRYYLGMAFSPEWNTKRRFRKFSPTAGAFFEAQISRHSGLETGVYLRFYSKVSREGGRPVPRGTTASFRLGYKFWSDILNFSAGMLTDVKMSNNGNDPRNVYGPYLSIGKDFKISRNRAIFIEPEIHVNPILNAEYGFNSAYEGTFIGLGAKLKFGL